MSVAEMNVTHKRKKASALVHIFAVAHAGVAFLLANTIIGDTLILTGLTYWMIHKIGDIYGCNDLSPWKIMGKVLGFVGGTYLAGKLLFFLPGVGNAANAASTIAMTETIGWTCIFLMETFQNPRNVSDSDLKQIIRNAKFEAAKHQEENERLASKLTSSDREKLRDLAKKVKSGNLSEEEKDSILDEMEQIRNAALMR